MNKKLIIVGVIALLRRLMEDFARYVVVQLKLKHGGDGVGVVVAGGIIDVRLGGRIAEFLASRGRRFHSLEVAHVFPPAGVPLFRRQVLAIHVSLPMSHSAAGPKDERQGPGE